MIKVLKARTFGNMKDGLKKGADALERTRRMEFRRPWTYRQGARPWLVGTFAVSALAAVAGILYFRKRRQITDRYSESDPEDVEALNAGRLNSRQTGDERPVSTVP